MSSVGDSQDSVIFTVTRRWTGWSRSRFLAEAQDFSLLQNIQTSPGSHASSTQHIPGALSSVIKWPGCGANHSLCSSIKNEWSHTSTPTICIHGMYRNTHTFCDFSVQEIPQSNAWKIYSVTSHFTKYMYIYIYIYIFVLINALSGTFATADALSSSHNEASGRCEHCY